MTWKGWIQYWKIVLHLHSWLDNVRPRIKVRKEWPLLSNPLCLSVYLVFLIRCSCTTAYLTRLLALREVFLRNSAIMMETAWGKLLMEIFYQRRFFPPEQGRAQFPIDSSERSFWVNVDFVSTKTYAFINTLWAWAQLGDVFGRGILFKVPHNPRFSADQFWIRGSGLTKRGISCNTNTFKFDI